MFIAKTPLRISFFGGGSDFRSYYEKHGGKVLSTTIDKFSYVIIRSLPPYFPYRNQLNYSATEKFNDPNELQHPLVREAMKFYGIDGVQIVYYADLPARSGIGSSSSFSVGLVNTFHSMKNEELPKRQLAEEAIYLERNLCCEAGGIQDQIAAAYGGFNLITFSGKGFEVSPIEISQERKDELAENIMLFFTGKQRLSYKISEVQEKNIDKNIKKISRMTEFVDEAVEILKSERNLSEFGKLLDDSWQIKRTISDRITDDDIDLIYKRAMNAGALGGKLSGAGGGGFMFFYVEKEHQESVKNELSDLIYVPFKIENNGSRIIYSGEDVLKM